MCQSKVTKHARLSAVSAISHDRKEMAQPLRMNPSKQKKSYIINRTETTMAKIIGIEL
jgi:hypothetical protein